MDILNSMAYFWLILSLVFLLIESAHPGLFFFISFFFGGLSAAGVTLWNFSLIAQTVVFFITTMIALIVLRYCVMPLIAKDRPHERTNVYALQGKKGFVVQKIEHKQSGMVKINGSLWGARCMNGDTLEVGSEIEVIDVRGTHVVVKNVTNR